MPAKAKISTIAGILVFVGGGLGTVLLALTSFGGDGGALDTARRNHSADIVKAAALAVGGLFLGATYTIINATWKTRTAKYVSALVLTLAVLCVSVGVVLGVSAAVVRAPGRPAIALARSSTATVTVQVTAEGLASTTSYEARVEGWNQRGANGSRAKLVASLLTGRFSPGQDGKLNWRHAVNISTQRARPRINYLLVAVSKDAGDAGSCVVPVGAQTESAPTCLYTRVPSRPDAVARK